MKPAYEDALRHTCEVAEAHAAEADAAAAFPTEALTAMRESGLLGLVAPAEFGGTGGITDLVDVTIALGRADMSVAMIFAMHCQQVLVLDRYGSPRLREHVLPAVADGKVYLASVTTETKTGGHLLTSDSPSRRTTDGLRIDRDAPVVTGGAHADGFVITLLAPGAASPSEVSLVYAARDQLEVEVRGEWRSLGMRATESVPMRLTGTVPEWHIIGEPGGFRTITAQWFAPLAHVGWAAAWLGTAAGAYSRVLRHLRSEAGRTQVNPSSELLLARLATARARLDVVHGMLRHAVSVLERGRDITEAPAQLLLNALKTEAADLCYDVVNKVIELIGLRHGYLVQSPLRLERALRDLRSAALNYSNDRLRLASGGLALMDAGVRLA